MIEPPKYSPGSWVTIMAVGLGLCLIAWIAIPNFAGSRWSKRTGIINNLRQIDAAKDMWRWEHRATTSGEIAWQQLEPYLRRSPYAGELVPSVAGEIYRLNPLGIGPEAQLTRRVEVWPKGTIIRLDPGQGSYTTVLP